MKFHPFAQKFPLLHGAEWDEFKESISKDGFNTVPILFRIKNGEEEGLDGRNRWKACEELGIAPTVKEIKIEDDEVKDLIIRLNLRRRQLDPVSRAAIIADLLSEGKTYRQVADTMGVSAATVSRDAESVSRETGNGQHPSPRRKLKSEKPKKKRRLSQENLEFDWAGYSGALGKMFVLISELADRFKFNGTPYASALDKKLREYNKAFKDAYRQFAKKDPPLEAFEKCQK